MKTIEEARRAGIEAGRAMVAREFLETDALERPFVNGAEWGWAGDDAIASSAVPPQFHRAFARAFIKAATEKWDALMTEAEEAEEREAGDFG